MQIDEIVRKLKYDFSEIEYNFRDLNKVAMEEIALRDDSKSGVLDSIFEIEEKIRQSDQGKSFFSFWQLLTDVKKSEKLSTMLENLYSIDTINQISTDEKLKDTKYKLLKSGEKIYKVSAKLIEQLRRFVDDRVWIENKRVLELCKDIEKSAIEIKEDIPTKRDFFHIKGDRVQIDSIFEKTLYTPKELHVFQKTDKIAEVNIDMESFYNIFFVDEELLKRNISAILLKNEQTTLEEIIKKYGVKKGVSELVGYISIAKNSDNVIVDNEHLSKIKIIDSDGIEKVINMPKIIFTKGT